MNRKLPYLATFAVMVVAQPLYCELTTTASSSSRATIPYLQRFRNFTTTLTRKGPAPLTPKPLETPDGWHALKYASTDGLELKAWVHVPQRSSLDLSPAIVYFHGNFALHHYDFVKCKPFLDAGYVVLLPTLRGENRNPGHCELFLSEVKDGMNAVRWIASQKFVDRARVYTFGHSAGGVISAMLSLHDGLPIRMGGSSGGLYDVDLFDAIANRVPFDLNNPIERELRVLPGNLRWMKRPHVAYVGKEDMPLRGAVTSVREELRTVKRPQLRVILHSGNHNSALPESMSRFLKYIEASR